MSGLAVVLMLVGPAPAFVPPAYRLDKGQKLCYTTTGETRSGSATSFRVRHREFYVVGWGAGQGRFSPEMSTGIPTWRLVVKTTDSSYRFGPDSVRRALGSSTEWARFELGREALAIEPRSSSDIQKLFVPLAPDTAMMRAGIVVVTDSLLREVEYVRLAGRSLQDSLLLFRMNTATPLDSVYGVSASAVVTLDTRRGLPVRREAESRRDDGRGIARTRSVTTLDSVTAFDTAGFRPFAADLDQWFGAKRAFDDRTDELQRRDDTNPARWHVAESLLAEAASAVRDSVVRRLFDEELASYREAAGPMLEELRGRLGRLGKPAPDWTLADLDGKEYRLKQFLGRVVVLDFWYRACPWCIRAMPALDALAREFRGKGVVVLGMNTDESLGDARFVVDRLHLSYPSLRCGDLAKKYGVTGFPTLFVIDRRGRISDIRVGFEPDMAERLRRSIRRALGEE